MIELVFPTAAALFLYFVAVPLLTIASSLALRVYRRRVKHAHEMGSAAVWLLLVLPVLLPSLWLIAAAGHQLDGHHEVVACLAAHDVSIVCIDLLLVLLFVVAPWVFRVARQPRDGAPPTSLSAANFEGIGYQIGAGVPGLVCTRGLLKPRIELDERIAGCLNDEQLRSVLLHENAHAAGRDPLRKWVARLCLSVNPFAALLRTDLARWELGREVRCDLQAVEMGADRFRLAEALVLVARHRPRTLHGCCGLIDIDTLDLRVRILCDRTLPALRREYATMLMIVLTAAIVLPHHGDRGALDWLHGAAEAGWLMLAGG